MTDLAEEAGLAAALTTLAECPVAAFHLGGHREADFHQADLVVANPAVRPDNPWLDIARQNGVPLTTEIDLFLRHCPATTIGVTGSNGKSTTAAMIAAIVQADGRRTWLGGNIGRSLLDVLHEIQPGDSVVLELSSFQLTYLRPDTRVPHIGVITSFSPNHLDWHANLEEYAAAKRVLFQRQQPGDLAVINTLDRRLAAWQSELPGKVLPLVDNDDLPPLPMPGWHNRLNAVCAATAALAAGCSRAAIDRGLRDFRGLPQRMEMIAEIDGRTFFNDSTSTTPESTIAALESLRCPTLLLAGGHDKGLDFTEMVETIGRLAVGTAFYGEVGPKLYERLLLVADANDTSLTGHPLAGQRRTLPVPSLALQACMAVPSLALQACMADALAWCWSISEPGDAIVLSPGCSSHDQFRNFRERGQRFAELVSRLAGGG